MVCSKMWELREASHSPASGTVHGSLVYDFLMIWWVRGVVFCVAQGAAAHVAFVLLLQKEKKILLYSFFILVLLYILDFQQGCMECSLEKAKGSML